jgi:hypothetical protein
MTCLSAGSTTVPGIAQALSKHWLKKWNWRDKLHLPLSAPPITTLHYPPPPIAFWSKRGEEAYQTDPIRKKFPSLVSFHGLRP